MNRRNIESAARAAGPWTPEAAEAAALLRDLASRCALTDAEKHALAILRQREINESIRRRNAK